MAQSPPQNAASMAQISHQTLGKKVMRKFLETRSTTNDLLSGNDISFGSSVFSAKDLLLHLDDDIELVDYVQALDTFSKLWHSTQIPRDGMMWLSIIAVLNNEEILEGIGSQILDTTWKTPSSLAS